MQDDFLFEDGSLFSVPQDWRDVYDQRFSEVEPAAFEARLRFLVGKYMAHRATPSKFDGMRCPLDDDARFDDERFYADRWDRPLGAG